MVRDEGVIKFSCAFSEQPLPSSQELDALIEYRNRLYDDGLIGVYPDGIGFGNISVRCNKPADSFSSSIAFLISASQTGHIAKTDIKHFTMVTDYSIESNSVSCQGPLIASSESLTHAMIYETFPDALAVVHVHSPIHWGMLQGMIPTSRKDVAYGTPDMAREVERLGRDENLGESKIFVMAGHEDGILSFGESLSDAYSVMRLWVA